jgi:hypothetical protein
MRYRWNALCLMLPWLALASTGPDGLDPDGLARGF